MDEEWLFGLIVSFVLSVFVYLTVPIFIRFALKKRYNKSKAIKVSVGVAVLGYFIFLLLYISLGVEGVPKLPVSVFYGFISYWILHDANFDKVKSDGESVCCSNEVPIVSKDSGLSDVKDTDVVKSNKVNVSSSKVLLVDRGWRIASIVLIVVSSALLLALFFCMDLIDRLEVDGVRYTEMISSLNDEYDKLDKEYRAVRTKATFFDSYAVIASSDSEFYHKYDCEFCDKSNFFIYNSALADRAGFVPCPFCCK